MLENDKKALLASGEKDLLEVVMATHADMTTTEFEQIVKQWIAAAQHPRFKRPFTDLVFQPMLELLAYLRANGFKTFIVSGGGIEFMRPWTEKVYGVPPEQGWEAASRQDLKCATASLFWFASRRLISSMTRPVTEWFGPKCWDTALPRAGMLSPAEPRRRGTI